MKCSVAILITCFNRKYTTLNSLSALNSQLGIENIDVRVYLVEDGCTDGTGEAVKEKFPDVVVIKGSGSLFWNGGMRLAWETALKFNPDFYLWINDDSFIYDSAISKLLTYFQQLENQNKSVGALLGSMVDPDTKKLTYGGRLKGNGLNPLKIGPIVIPTDTPQKCDFINGNLILVPSSTVNEIGILDGKFTHSMGDYDYGLRAIDAGLDCWVAPGIYGECKTNPIKGSFKDKSLSLKERIQKTKSITQLPPLSEWKYFVKAHGGIFWWLLFLDALLRSKVPKLWFLIRGKA